MRKKIFDFIIIIIFIFLLYEIIIRKTLVFDSINYSLNIWVNNLVPTLFPFFIISDILINYNFTQYIPKIFKKICKFLFNITDNMVTILILSVMSGFPSNARNTRTLYDNGVISIDEANHILIFSHFANPVFILTTTAITFLHSKNIGIILLISHYLSNIILGLLFRNYFKHNDSIESNDVHRKNFGNILISSIKKSIDTILLICGIVTIFLLLSSIFNTIFNFNIYNSMILKGLLEITIGIESLGKLSFPLIYKAIISSCILAFGGFSVHMQVISQIAGTNIKYKYFFIGRLFQMILSGFITYLLCLFYL